jgi:hypothetical protein
MRQASNPLPLSANLDHSLELEVRFCVYGVRTVLRGSNQREREGERWPAIMAQSLAALDTQDHPIGDN